MGLTHRYIYSEHCVVFASRFVFTIAQLIMYMIRVSIISSRIMCTVRTGQEIICSTAHSSRSFSENPPPHGPLTKRVISGVMLQITISKYACPKYMPISSCYILLNETNGAADTYLVEKHPTTHSKVV